MKLIKPDKPQCVLASFAMALDDTMENLIEELGHNGMEQIIDKDAPPPPHCYRSFHPQEFVDICLERNLSLVMIERHPALKHGHLVVDHTPLLGEERFFAAFAKGSGVVFGVIGDQKDRPHAVAWCREETTFYDPRGYTWEWNKEQDFHPLQFFLIQKAA